MTFLDVVKQVLIEYTQALANGENSKVLYDLLQSTYLEAKAMVDERISGNPMPRLELDENE